MERKKIPNAVRFEVFKRDKFSCQYCGRKSPDVVLEVDHLTPVAKGGGNDILNLVTSCVACNSGKSDRVLSDHAMLEKTRGQLEELEERRQQLEMMVRWRESLVSANDTLTESAERLITAASGYTLNDHGRSRLRKVIKDFGYDETCNAIGIAMERYLRWHDGKPTQDSFEIAFGKVSGVCKGLKAERENPAESQLYFALNIWKKAAGYPPPLTCKRAIEAIRAAHAAGMEIERIKRICSTATWITRLEQELLNHA